MTKDQEIANLRRALQLANLALDTLLHRDQAVQLVLNSATIGEYTQTELDRVTDLMDKQQAAANEATRLKTFIAAVLRQRADE